MGAAWWLLRRNSSRMGSRAWRIGVISALGVLFLLPLAGVILSRMKPTPVNGLRGRYYRETRPNGFAPHIDRVDPILDLENVGEMGGMPAPSRVMWTGTLTASVAGVYQFRVDADDLGWLTIDGQPVIPDPGDVQRSSAYGVRFLTKGPHRIEADERNLAGDASMRLSWAPPNEPMQIIPLSALTPE
jgi:hypothetical protein